MESLVNASILKEDLLIVDKYFVEDGIWTKQGILNIKQALTLLANFYDFERTQRLMYKTNPDLSEKYRKYESNLEFSKYIRNKYIGHITPELITKTLEWNPEVKLFLQNESSDEKMIALNIKLLETVINTYVNADGKHKVFDSETDLIYPPDNKRFVEFIEVTIRGAIDYLHHFIKLKIALLGPELAESSTFEGMLKDALVAGKTEFKFITK